MDDNASKACVLLLNLPKAAFCGIDLLSFTASPRFVGIKHLPLGWHFLFVGANNSFSLRHGAWFEVKLIDGPADLFVKKWDAETEELVDESDPQEILKWRANLGGVWREGMTPYRQTATQAAKSETDMVEEDVDWPKLTSNITADLLHRITASQSKGDHHALNSASSAHQDQDVIPGLTDQTLYEHQQELGFLPINLKQTWREGAIGRERTEAAQDRSWALQNLLDHHAKDLDEILGELQFTFIMVLALNNNSCLEQWRRILTLLLTCKVAVTKYYEAYSHFLRIIKLQIEHCDDAENGLFDMSDEGGTLLKQLLGRFRIGLEQVSGEGKMEVMDELDDLEDYLRDKHGWLLNESFVRRGMIDLEDGERVEMDMNDVDEEDESGDYAPVIVELTAQQAESLGRPESFVNNRKETNADHEAQAYDDGLDADDLDERY